MEFKDLSPELQEKAKSAKSPQELLEMAKAEGYELTDEELEGVAGGWCSDYVCREYEKYVHC
ncbi:MAG: Nif11-like leader peptide family natural product precursor [Coriobacteriaceae bacterium]|nr:Nif11 family protein [Coriobacteriaceae bacterium]MDO4891126.1 Nif11-like leader peptide family natural product precursor [Coriobacteriaceae bacterium]